MREIDLKNWNRKKQFEHFRQFEDPYFSLVAPVDVSLCYQKAKENKVSFSVSYLHACMTAINKVAALKMRIVKDKVIEYDTIRCSTTIAKPDHTFGLTFIPFDRNFNQFLKSFLKEKERVLNSADFFPPENGDDCIHCSAIPWVRFSSHKEPRSGEKDSVPKLSFSKIYNDKDKKMMNVAIAVNHALVDGYHIGLFFEEFQKALNL